MRSEYRVKKLKSEFLVIIRKASIEILAHQSRYFYEVLQVFFISVKSLCDVLYTAHTHLL